MLKMMVGRPVILVGTNAGMVQEGVYRVTTSDKSVVQVMLPPNVEIAPGGTVQLSGKVTHQGDLECTRKTDMNQDFNMDNYERAITLARSAAYSPLFNDN